MFVLIFMQLLKMLFILVLGFFCYRIGMVDQKGSRTLSNLLLTIVNPFLIITVYQQTAYDPELVAELLIAFAAATFSHFAGIFIAHFLIPARSGSEYALERFGAIYSNCGFIGIPLVGSVIGERGIFLLTAYMAVFNLFCWSHGLILLHGEFSFRKLREGLLSPMFVATIVAIVLYFMPFRLPEVFLDSMNYVADMNTPLAMMVAGFSIAQSDSIRAMFLNPKLYLVSLLKLVVMPLSVLFCLILCRVPKDVVYTIVIAAACPAAATVTMMAIRYDKNYKYASEIFSFTTLISMLTIPLIVLVAQTIL